MQDDSSLRKRQLRQRLLSERAALGGREREHHSRNAISILTDSALWQASTHIGIYLPLKTELNISQLWLEGASAEKHFYAPRVLPSGKMTFHKFESTSNLEAGMGGIVQPTSSATEVALDSIDLFLVPLVGCDETGNRLGFGKGCYDQTLNQGRGFKLGVGFDLQRQGSVPVDEHDIPMDGFLSERGLTFFSR